MLDISCSGFNWMKEVDLNNLDYIGADIVNSLIQTNIENYASDHISFRKLDLIDDELPIVDLIFCRDCLVNLSFKEIYKVLLNIKRSESKYLLLTSFIRTKRNKDINTDEWRKLNFQESPFNLVSLY